MSQPEPIEIHRTALYEQVWTTPISRLASSFGLSDNGLRKVCKKTRVPTPPRGYWAKLRHGYDVSPVPLPALPEDAPDDPKGARPQRHHHHRPHLRRCHDRRSPPTGAGGVRVGEAASMEEGSTHDV